MNKFLFTITIILYCVNLFAQEFPKELAPKENYTNSKSDTLWILTDKQFKKTLEVGRDRKLLIEKSQNQEILIDTLKSQSLVKDELIQILKKDRDFYMYRLDTCRNEIDIVGKEYKKCKNFKRVAIIGGLAGIVIAFLAGAYIFH